MAASADWMYCDFERSAVAIQMCHTGTASTPDAVGLAGELNKRTQKQFAQTIYYRSAFQKLHTQFYWRMNFDLPT
jgi:hypothetical protein